MAGKAKVVLTDYVWESLDVEKKTLEGLASLVALQTKTPAQFFPEAADCDALLNTYAGPITAEVMARMPRCKIIARYGIGVDTIDLEAATARPMFPKPTRPSVRSASRNIGLPGGTSQRLPRTARS